jgi:hypothetical protein
MRDQTTRTPKPTQDRRLKINPDPSTWSPADHDRVINHVCRHQPGAIETSLGPGLCALFDPPWSLEFALSMLRSPGWSDVILDVERDDADDCVMHFINYTEAVQSPRLPAPQPAPPINGAAFQAEKIIAPPLSEPPPQRDDLAGADGLDAPEGAGDRAPPLSQPPPLDGKRAQFREIDLKAQRKQLRWFRSASELAALRINFAMLYEQGDLGGRIGLSEDQYKAYWRAHGRFPNRIWPASLDDPKVREKWQKQSRKDRNMEQLALHHPQAPPATRPPMTRYQASVNALPRNQADAITIAQWARKVRRHPAWRAVDGSLLTLGSIKFHLGIIREFPGIGSDQRGHQRVWHMWRRP